MPGCRKCSARSKRLSAAATKKATMRATKAAKAGKKIPPRKVNPKKVPPKKVAPCCP